VHRVLQEADFAATSLETELRERVTAGLALRDLEIGDDASVIAGLEAAIETPLGSGLGDLRLRDLPVSDRLDEFEFELPLVGGDDATGRVTMAAIASVIREQSEPREPLFRYAEQLSSPGLRQSVRGYLAGAIDMVARLAPDQGQTRFVLFDYKTNWLGAPGEALTPWNYRPSALVAEMQRAHYLLQALLYTVALHRYLRWRLADYDAERNLAGVLYLFVRGMIGPDTPTIEGGRCGVFAWQPPGALVEALSDVLDTGAA
jgi:exodeoxyribonuclease V beta subunit